MSLLYELSAKLKLDTTEYDQQARDAIKTGQKIGETYDDVGKQVKTGGLTDIGKTFATALGSFGGAKLVTALFDYSKQSIELASNLEEVQNVVDVVFGQEGAAKLDNWAKRMKYTAGMGELTAKQYASTFGGIFAGAGLEGQALENMSTQMTQLVGDMASFYNLSHSEAFTKVMSIFAGETEPLRRIGIDASVEQMKKYAEAMDLEWAKLNDTERAQLRYDYLLDKTQMAQGDFDRTAGNYANQMRLMEENFASLSTSFGTWLLDAVTPALNLVNKMFEDSQHIGQYITGADQEEKSRMEQLVKMQAEAATAYGVLERLHGVAGRSTAEEAAYVQALEKMVQLYPELSDVINVENQTISGGLGAVKERVDEYDRLLEIEAKRETLSRKQQILDDANNTLTEKRVELINAEEDARARQQAAVEALQQAYEMAGMGSQYGSFADFFASMNKEGLANLGYYDATNSVWKDVEHAILTTLAAEYESTSGAEQDAYQDITDKVSQTSAAAENAIASISGYEDAVADAEIEVSFAADAVDLANRRLSEMTSETGSAQSGQKSLAEQNHQTAQSFRDAAAAANYYGSSIAGLPFFGGANQHFSPASVATRGMESAQSSFAMTPGDVQNAVQAALAAWATPVGGEEYAVVVSRQMAHGMRGKR